MNTAFNLKSIFVWLRCTLSFLLFIIVGMAAIHYQTSTYLIRQACGQLNVIMGAQSIATFSQKNKLTTHEKQNLELLEKIKQFSTDSLAFKPTKNYTAVFDEQQAGLLWVITASKPFELSPYEWTFPIVGKVSYKGFFDKHLATTEYNHLVGLGYDVDMRSVSGWSTLGWFNDPILRSMLQRSKGSFCNLIFHELFHSTFYKASDVNLNENLASFVAHKATLLFLKNDSTAINYYLRQNSIAQNYTKFILRQKQFLKKHYVQTQHATNRYELKLKAFWQITDSIKQLCSNDSSRCQARIKFLWASKNAGFIDIEQYDGLQDSMEVVFNKIYGAKLKKLVRDLRQNGIND